VLQGRRLEMTDLYGSGALEKFAAAVILLNKVMDQDADGNPIPTEFVDFDIRKNRFGQNDVTVRMLADLSRRRFEELSQGERPAQRAPDLSDRSGAFCRPASPLTAACPFAGVICPGDRERRSQGFQSPGRRTRVEKTGTTLQPQLRSTLTTEPSKESSCLARPS